MSKDTNAPPPVAAGTTFRYTLAAEGLPGEQFTIKGGPFGDDRGEVAFGGQQAQVTSWSDTRIKGFLPNVTDENAELVVTLNNKVSLRTWMWARSVRIELTK